MHSVNIIVNNANHFWNVWECVVTGGMYFGVHFFWKTELGNVIHFIYDAKYWSISLASVFLLVGIFLRGFFSLKYLDIAFKRRLRSHCFGCTLQNPKLRKREREKNCSKQTQINSNELTLHFAQIKCLSFLCINFAFCCNILAYLFIQCCFIFSPTTGTNLFETYSRFVSNANRDLLGEIENSISDSTASLHRQTFETA